MRILAFGAHDVDMSTVGSVPGGVIGSVVWFSLLGACTHVRAIREVPRDFVGQRARLSLNDGREIEAWATPSPTGIVWRTHSGEEIASDLMRSARFDRVSAGWGVADGILLGFLAGAITGIVAGAAAASDPELDANGCNPDKPFDYCITAGYVAFVSTGLGVMGSLVGGLVGLARGAKFEYLLPNPRVVAEQDRELERRLDHDRALRSSCEPILSKWLSMRADSWRALQIRDNMSPECRAFADRQRARR